MKKDTPITKETIKLNFKNQFDLVNYSIKLVSQLIYSGRSPHVHVDSFNPAVVIIDEIGAGKDKLEDIILAAPESVLPQKEEKKSEHPPEKRKARRIFA